VTTKRLKMQEWKMYHEHYCRGGKCISRSQRWKMLQWKKQEQTAWVENVEAPWIGNLRINWNVIKSIQIGYLTYEIHIIRQYNIYHVSKKRCHFYFANNFVKFRPTFIARQHTDAWYWYSNSICPSVCLSVRNVTVSEENGIVIVFHHTVAQSF